MMRFGERVDGYTIEVLNEREIRAAAGLLFLAMFVTIGMAAFGHQFTPLKYAVIGFLSDILLRLLVSPRWAPTLIVGRWIVRNQVPEWVGARQKQFAWWIGAGLASVMLALQVIVNAFSPITGIICLICLVFLFFEAAFGICLGCLVYNLAFKERAQHCPGEVCTPHERHPAQRTGFGQWALVLAFAGWLLAVGGLFHDQLSEPPFDLFGLSGQASATGTR
jgi:hypothetical protein